MKKLLLLSLVFVAKAHAIYFGNPQAIVHGGTDNTSFNSQSVMYYNGMISSFPGLTRGSNGGLNLAENISVPTVNYVSYDASVTQSGLGSLTTATLFNGFLDNTLTVGTKLGLTLYLGDSNADFETIINLQSGNGNITNDSQGIVLDLGDGTANGKNGVLVYTGNGNVTGSITGLSVNLEGGVGGTFVKGIQVDGSTATQTTEIGATISKGSGDATSWKGLEITVNGAPTVSSATAIDVNMSAITSPAKKIGLNVEDGYLNTSGNTTLVDSVAPTTVFGNFFNTNTSILLGAPVTNTLSFGNLFLANFNFHDDMAADPTGLHLGQSNYVFNGAIVGDAGKTADAFNSVVAVSTIDAGSTGGTITYASMFRTTGITPFGGPGTLAVTNMYGFKLDTGFCTGATITNCYGLYIEDAGAENFLAGVLSLGESGGGGDKISISAPALGASYSLVLPTTDGNAGEFLQTDGSGNTTWAPVSSTAAFVDIVAVDTLLSIADGADQVIKASGAGTDITLYDCTTSEEGYKVTVKRNDVANSISVIPDAGDTIDTGGSITLSSNFDAYNLVCDGAGDWILR